MKSLFHLFLALEALCLCLSFFLARILASKVSTQLIALTEQIRSRLPKVQTATVAELDIKGGGEVRELADSFNQLMKNLRDSQAKVMAAERQKSIQELAYQVAHDIRSPLSFISIFATVNKNIPGVDALRTAAERLNGIAADLLNQTKIAKSPSAKRTSVSPDAILKELAREFEQSVAGLHFDFQGEAVPVKVNENRLKRVLSNVIQNAIEAMSDRAEKSVGVRFEASDRQLVIKISDSGSGMNEETLRKIQSGPGVTTKTHGTGLGVFGSQRMIREMGGEMEIKSVLYSGTTVELTLDRA